MDFKISLDHVDYHSKPRDKNEIAGISGRIGSGAMTVDSGNLVSVVTNIGKLGHTFSPATFKNGKRNKENYEQSQLVVLDFDNDRPDKIISWKQVKHRLEQYNLQPLFAYDTFSSDSTKQRFRVTFLHDTPIDDIRAAELSQKILFNIFPEADKSCISDGSKIYYGSNKPELLHLDQSMPTINIESLVRNMSYYLKNKYGPTHYKEKIKKFANENSLKLNNKGMIDISIVDNPTGQNGKKTPNSIIVDILFGKNLPSQYYCIKLDNSGTLSNLTNPDSTNECKLMRGRNRSDSIKDISSKCQLFKGFQDGTKWLNHDELFGIATNIIHVETGSKIFLDIMLANSHYPSYMEKYNLWDFYLGYYKDNQYKPQGCEYFCPYQDTCNRSVNILSTVTKSKYHTVEKLSNFPEEYHTLEEVEKDVKRQIEQAIYSPKNIWHIIKAVVGLGKSQAYLEIVRDASSYRFLIVVPTNKLKMEIESRAKKMGITVAVSPSLHDDLIKDEIPDDVWDQIVRFYDSGKHYMVNQYIKKVAYKRDIQCLKKYLKKLEDFHKSDCHGIITHKRLLHLPDETLAKYDCVIIDEDIILKSIIPNQETITIPELKKLKKRYPKTKLSGKINKILKHIQTNEMFTAPSFEWYEKNEDDDDKSTGIDVSSFCKTKYFIYRQASKEPNLSEDCITFFKPVKFKNNVKYVMVSATIDEKVCKYYFGENNVEFRECNNVKYAGELIWFYDKSISRRYLDEHSDTLKRIMEKYPYPTITFKNYGGEHHFGAIEGINELEGQTINVIGCNHQVEFIYKLFAYLLSKLNDGFEFDKKAQIHYQEVEHNGWKFWFSTYDDTLLRDIQFYIIESELEQAVGRARLLRNECTVYLFSDFPLCQAVIRKSDYDDANEAKIIK